MLYLEIPLSRPRDEILQYVERSIRQLGFSDTYCRRIRLLTEEMLCALEDVLRYCGGSVYLETDEQRMFLHLKLEGVTDKQTRAKLESFAKTTRQKNGAAHKLAALFTGKLADKEAAYDKNNATELLYSDEDDIDNLEGVEKAILRTIADEITVQFSKTGAELVVAKRCPISVY